MSASVKLTSRRLAYNVFPSGLQATDCHRWFGVLSCVSGVIFRVAQSSSVMLYTVASFGLVFSAMVYPSGDHRGLSSRISGVLLRLITAPPSLGMAKTSHNSFPPVSCCKTLHLPSGDQVSPY